MTKQKSSKTLNTAAVRSRKLKRAKTQAEEPHDGDVSTATITETTIANINTILAQQASAEPEAIPVAEAISQAIDAGANGTGTEPIQQQLIESPPFNFAGALEAIASKNRDVKFARDRYESAKEHASETRKSYEFAAKSLQDLIDSLERRERQVRQEAEDRAAREAAAATPESTAADVSADGEIAQPEGGMAQRESVSA